MFASTKEQSRIYEQRDVSIINESTILVGPDDQPLAYYICNAIDMEKLKELDDSTDTLAEFFPARMCSFQLKLISTL